MSDNTIIPAGAGGDSIRDIDKVGIKTQVVTLDVGGAGAEALISSANPLPVGGIRRDADTAFIADLGAHPLLFNATGRLKVSTTPADTAAGTGSITAAAQTVFMDASRTSNVVITMVATTLVGHNATFEFSNDSTNGTNGNWFAASVCRSNANVVEQTTGVLAATPAYGWSLNANAYRWVRVRASAHTSGTAAYTFQPSSFATEPIPATQALPAGTATIGAVNIAAAQTLATVTTVGTVTTLANGQTAHSAASTGSPVRIGGRVSAAVDTTLVAGDASDLFMSTAGQAITKDFAVAANDWAFACAAPIAVTTDVVIKAAAAAGVRNYITALQIINASGTIATEVVIKDGATVIWRGYVGTSLLLNSAVGVVLPTPIVGTAATALNFACATAGASVYVNAQGFIAP